jgi:peptide/nickel transport system permease protein
VATTTVTPKRRARSESTWAVAWRRLRRHRFAMISLAILAIFILVAIFAPYLAPYDPFRQPRGAGIRAQFFQPPSSVHWLGTDDLGRDVFSRLIFGARISLLVGFTVAFSNIFVGTIMGTLAGYFSGRPFRFYLGPLNREGGGWHLPFALWRVLSWLLFYGALYLVARIAWTLAGPAVQAGFAGEWTTNSLFSALGLGVALAVVAAGAVWGVAGRFRLDIDIAISRLIDFMLTIPSLPLLLILSALLRDPGTGFGRWTQAIFGDAASVFIIIFILALFGWISSARLVRGSILSIREQDFTTAAQALGVPQWRIMFRHLVPNAMAPIIVDGTLAVGVAILVEAALSFLGFGIQPPVATWGNMLNNAQNYIFFAPWLAFPPGILIVITVLAINFLGDGLRDALDPRSQL